MKLPQSPPAEDPASVLFKDPAVFERVAAADLFRPTVGERYVHWDKLRHFPARKGVTLPEWWAAIKLARRSQYRVLPLRDGKGVPFRIGSPDALQRQLSEIDRDLSGRMRIPEQLTNSETRDRYLVSALIEEAITSSQLEGASTTSPVAREMLRSRRKPRDKSERMIHNNFVAMQFARDAKEHALTPELICDIHRRVTEDTLDDDSDAGTIRKTDSIHVVGDGGIVLHVPPSASELPKRIDRLCEFANGGTPREYVHPVVRAVLLHFWLAYEHPFVDGNGRTARALYYWSMLRSGYWLAEFISISHMLRKAPAKYARAYLYSETDENDATYFVLYQLDVLQRGIKALHEYVTAKVDVIRKTQLILRRSQMFNHRQLALLGHALAHPDRVYTVGSHSMSHQVTPQTARVDLTELADQGFLHLEKIGKRFVFNAPGDLEARLQEFGAKQGTKRA